MVALIGYKGSFAGDASKPFVFHLEEWTRVLSRKEKKNITAVVVAVIAAAAAAAAIIVVFFHNDEKSKYLWVACIQHANDDVRRINYLSQNKAMN